MERPKAYSQRLRYQMNRPRLLASYVGTVAVSGCLLVAHAAWGGVSPRVYGSVIFWLLAVVVVAGEFIHIKVVHANETSRVTFTDPFILSMLFIFGLGPALLIKTVASVAEDVSRRRVWWKTVFNVGQFGLTLTFVGLAFRFVLGDAAGTAQVERQITASLLAAGCYFVINLAIVHVALSIATGTPTLAAIRNHLKVSAINQGIVVGTTPVVMAALQQSLWLFPLLLIPLIVVYHAEHMTQRHKTLADQLRKLYETTRITQGSAKSQHSIRMLLERICEMFSCQRASITLFPRSSEDPATRTTLDLESGDFTYGEVFRLDPTQGIWARVASEDRGALLAAPIHNERLADYFNSRGIKDLMAAPLRSDHAVIGVIEVSNRAGLSKTFETEDLKLFETLANHASISLENARLIDELEDSLVHLTEMNQLKDDFVASVSHELRTPLTSIRGYAKTLLRPDAHFSPEETQAFLETIDRQSQRLHRLIEDLLVVSRIESASGEDAVTQESSLREMVDEVVDELRAKLEGRPVTIDLDDHLPRIETDTGKVHQILCNLVDNAVKYSSAGTPIEIEGRTQGAGVTITVRDSGPGIDEEVHEKIFDRFYQVDQSITRKVGGAGLGLYICRKLAQTLGGRLWLESSGASGSEFSLWIPSNAAKASLDLSVELKRLTG